MSTIVALDARRRDLRTNVLENPYWISSDLIDGPSSEDLGVILFSFPKAGEIIFVEQCIVQVVVAFTAGTTFLVGTGTIADDTKSTGDNITTESGVFDQDAFIMTADVTVGTAGFYGPATGHSNDWLAAKIAGSFAAPYIITGAVSAVPVVFASLANAATILAGTARIHMLISRCPGA